MLFMDMAKQMQARLYFFYSRQKFCRTIVYLIVKIKNTIGRTMGNQYICVGRYGYIVTSLTIRNTIFHEHGNTIEFNSVNYHTGVAQIMHILIQPVYFGFIQAGIVIATDKNLVGIREVAKPVHKINGFLLAPVHGEISRMYKDVSIGQLCEPPMLTVGVGNMYYFHAIIYRL